MSIASTGFPTTDIPDDLLPLIGRVIVLWAHIEHRILKTIYDAAKLKMKYGRVLVSNVSADRLVNVIEEILEADFKELDAPEEDVREFKRRLKKAAIERNQLAHGVWGPAEGSNGALLRVVTGERPKEHSSPNLRSRKLDPDAILITRRVLKAQIQNLEHIISKLQWLRDVSLRPRPSP